MEYGRAAKAVAGSNQIPPFNGVQVASGPFTGTIPDNFDFEENQEATTNPENPFKHFPTGDPTGGEVTEVRNPTVVCQLDPNPCPSLEND